MKRRTLIIDITVALVAAVASLFFLSGHLPTTTNINVGVENYPPFISVDETGKTQGISVNVLNDIAEKNNLRTHQVGPYQLSKLMEYLASGKIDVVTSVTRTPEREKIALFTDPYMIVGTTLLSKAADPKSVCVGKGYGIEDWARQRFEAVVTADNDAGCVDLLLADLVQGVALDNIVLSSQQLSLTLLRTPLDFSYSLTFAISKKRPELVKIFNEELATQALISK